MTLFDRTQLIRVVTNLLNNAIQAIPEDRDPMILVSIHSNKKNVVITAAVRTAIGSFRGSLRNMQGHELGSIVVKEVLKRSKLNWKI